MICLDCKEEAEEVEIRDGFYYDYGSISGAWHDESYAGSSCCGAEVVEGKIFLDEVAWHTARRDHKTPKGDVYIHKGERYYSRIRKGYYVDGDGDRIGIVDYYKKPARLFISASRK